MTDFICPLHLESGPVCEAQVSTPQTGVSTPNPQVGGPRGPSFVPLLLR